MPPAWLIGPLVIKSSLVILIGSLLAGLLFFRIISPYSKSETKQRIDEVGTILITFVITLWIGKIIMNFSIFISDPIAILAYPSDSKSFYIAVFLTVLYGKYKFIRVSKHLIPLLFSWMVVFLTASFVYEFIQMIWGTNVHTLGYLGLLVTLIMVTILLPERIALENITLIILIGWCLGQWILSFFTNTTVFQFSLNPIFYLIIFIGSLVLFYFYKKLSMKG
ncbi:hypothetical protein [Aquibacillus saliphilus]|uniref:hypothetical protein n=1 Tax=Aquibacillus saliphilus TaxID=1909422 RepID=UPI001CF0A403|nr:hypothetical protein [Aquibacillus saliphilus]